MARTDAAVIAAALEGRCAGDGWIASCPACGYPKSLSITEAGERTLLFCHACQDQPAVLDSLRSMGLWRGQPSNNYYPPRLPASVRPKPDLGRQEAALRLWGKSQPLAGSLAEAYLLRRGLRGPWPPTLAFTPKCWHSDARDELPAMLAAVAHWPSEQVAAVHRTYLTRDGHKANVDPAKKSLGFIKGGAVRLAPAGPTLALSEGIETGLAFMAGTGLPTWACLSTGGLRGVVLPTMPLAGDVVIAADHDQPGLDAAHDTARRLACEGRRVRIVTPPRAGQDFADLLLEATI